MSAAVPVRYSKKTIVKSALFVSGFWVLTGVYMYGLFRLFELVNISRMLP